MNAHSNKPMPITAIGMDKQNKRLLEMVFLGPGRGEYILVEETEAAQGSIFDLDNRQASWMDYRTRHPHLPTIVLSLTEREIAGTIFVQKPLEINKLLKALLKLKLLRSEGASLTKSKASHLPPSQTTRNVKLTTLAEVENEEETLHQFCGYAPDINLRPGVGEKVYYEPDKYLQGFFEKAFALSQQLEGEGVLIEGLYTSTILLSDKNQLLCGYGATDGQWRTMALLPLSSSRLRMITISEIEIEAHQIVDHLVVHPLENFLWKIALWTARGRVPKGTSLNNNVRLTQWPNFTRLVLTPHALEIAALWMNQPHSLLQTAKVLEIPQRYVFSFFSAANTLRLVSVESGENLALVQPAATTSPGKRNLFQRLLARLRGHESL